LSNITSIDILDVPKLTRLQCHSNQLTSLDLSSINQSTINNFYSYNNPIENIIGATNSFASTAQVWCYDNKLPLSELYSIVPQVTTDINKRFGTQILNPRTAVVGVPVDWNPLPAQNTFDGGTNYTTYDVKIGSSHTGTNAPLTDYTVANGNITFNEEGTYTVIMKNAAIDCHPSQPTGGLQVIVTFTVEEPQGGCVEKHVLGCSVLCDEIQTGETFPNIDYSNPATQRVVARWEQDVLCGNIEVRVKDASSQIVGSAVMYGNIDGEEGDCGYWFEMDLVNVPYPNPTLSFEIYLQNGACGLSPIAPDSGNEGNGGGNESNESKKQTKGSVTSPIVYDYTINVVSPLPISLVDFNAHCRNGQVVLSWKTATETNNDYFTVERGEANGNTKAIRWSKVAEIKGAGNSSMPLSYGYADYSPFEGGKGDVIYYRLKQTDYNGQYEYFSPIVVSCPKSKEDIQIYPNPTTGMLYIQTATSASTDFRLYSVEGRVLKTGNTTEIDLSGYAKGVYFLKVNNTTFKVVKE